MYKNGAIAGLLMAWVKVQVLCLKFHGKWTLEACSNDRYTVLQIECLAYRLNALSYPSLLPLSIWAAQME